MDLPKNEAVFNIKYAGQTTGHIYEGDFKCLCVLTVGQKHQVELEQTRLIADHKNPTNGLAGLSLILANCRMRILDAPVWWQQSKGGADIMDEDCLIHLYDKLIEVEVQWREQVKAKAKALVEPTPKSAT